MAEVAKQSGTPLDAVVRGWQSDKIDISEDHRCHLDTRTFFWKNITVRAVQVTNLALCQPFDNIVLRHGKRAVAELTASK